MEKEKKIQWANNLRAAATVAVIVLHVSVSAEEDFKILPLSSWLVANIYDTAARWCVPMFVMLTGTFALNNYNGNLKIFLIKMFQRIGLPFIFWSIIYLFYYNGNDLLQHQITIHEKLSLVAEKLATGTAVHLWFVYMLIGIYFLIPILSPWVRHNNKAEQLFFISLWILFLFVEPLFEKYDISFDYSYFSGFVGYLILGNFLYKTPRRVNTVLLVLLFVSALIFTCIMTYRLSSSLHEMNEAYMDNFKPNIVLMGICVYLLFKNIQIKFPLWLSNGINKFCSYSYGIYLVHILVLDLFLKSGITYLRLPVIISIPIISLLCMVVSYVIIYVLKKIPYLRITAG